MDIPWNSLSEEALRGVIEEFVLREGTEYGARDYTLEEKIEQVKKQLQRGEIRITWDPHLKTCTLIRIK